MRFIRVRFLSLTLVRQEVRHNLTMTEKFKMLDVDANVDEQLLRKAYLQKVKENHPDVADKDQELIELDVLKKSYDDVLDAIKNKEEEKITIKQDRRGRTLRQKEWSIGNTY